MVSEGNWILEGMEGLEGVSEHGVGHLDIWGCPNLQGASEHMGAYKHMGVYGCPLSPHIQVN